MSRSPAISQDVMRHLAARTLLDRLERQGVTLRLSRGNIHSREAERIAPEDVAAIRRWKPILVVLLLVRDTRVLERVTRLASLVAPAAVDEGHCHTCGELLARHRKIGRCGWCAIAARLHAGCGVPEDVVGLFDARLVGDTPTRLERPLAYDIGAPAA